MESKLSFSFKTNQEILKKIGFIDAFKGKWGQLEGKESKYLNELKIIATIESIGSSTRIEGSKMTDEEVDAFVNAIKITSFKSRDEQEVFGYYDTLSLVYDSFEAIHLTENHLHQLHKTLLNKSTKDNRHKGKYKTLSNKVVANYPDGKQKVLFNTTEIHLVRPEMQAAIEWTNAVIDKKEIHPLIAIGAFIYEFLSIHPYQDGNGRLSRLITTLLLLRSGYDFVQYASVEFEIEKRKKDYYKALMAGQKHRYSSKEKIDEWMLFFLDVLEQTIVKLEREYESIKKRKSYLNNRQSQVLMFMEENEPIKIGDLVTGLNAHTPYILKKDVRYLVDEGLLTKIGKGKATIYLKNDMENEV
ncbi:MAG: Fic family protein [Bacteroidia bacterium]|jgi:Fic family protein